MDETKQKNRIRRAFLLLGMLLLCLLFVNLAAGSASLGLSSVLRAVLSGPDSGAAGSIVWNIRLPRLLAAALLGGALSVSGFLLQTFFANPIAGPFVLGISSGAKLIVALCMIFCLAHGIAIRSLTMITAAFCGALLCMGLILMASLRTRNMALLIVCGVMIGYICSAVTDIVVSFADDQNIVNLHYWSMGSFSGIGWRDLGAAAVTVAGALFCCVLLSKAMSAFQMGEVYAQTVGVNLRRFRAALILLSSLLSACVTAFAGPVSFVGIAVPHLMRSLFRTAKPICMIPACFLGGAVFCLFCDLLARTAFAPTELSIGSVTAVFGAPVVIAMLLKRKRGGVL